MTRHLLTVLDLSRPEFLAAVRTRGEYVHKGLMELKSSFPVIKEVRGLGLMWGLELAQEGADVVTACRERGLLVNCTQGNVIRLLPPLVVLPHDLDQGLGILKEALQAAFK